MARGAAGLVAALLIALASPIATLGSSGPADITAGYNFTYRTGLPELDDAHRWVLQGLKLPNGVCRYKYDLGPSEIPPAGWEIRSIAADVAQCAKLIEEGTPVTLGVSVQEEGTTVRELPTKNVASLDVGASAVTTSSQAAWQKVTWYDPLPFGGLWVNFDVTQINWSYNGSTVSAGSSSGSVGWRWGSGWDVTYSNSFNSYGPGSSFFLGETNSGFDNQAFCWPLQTAYTYYYYNRVWGHPNGTATRSQSSDTVDECVGPFHFDIQSAYGTWQP